ncbi:MAG: hypothetical protein ACLFNS_03240 [Desulfobacterales bacterium]
MAENFRITSRREGDKLYFELWGDFDGISAMELIYTLKDKASMARKIYVETDGIRRVLPFGKNVFQTHFNLSPPLTRKVIFIGNNWQRIAPSWRRIH